MERGSIESFVIDSGDLEGVFITQDDGYDLILQCPTGHRYKASIKIARHYKPSPEDKSRNPRLIVVDRFDPLKILERLEAMAEEGPIQSYFQESNN